MKDKFESYARRQRAFWDVPSEKSARFERVDTVSAGDDEKHRRLAEQDHRRVLEGITTTPASALLELGCGVGRMIGRMQAHTPFASLIGVDISKNMIEYSSRNLPPDSRVRLMVISGYDLAEVASDSIDFAYSVDVFIHIFDVDIIGNYLREVRRVLKDGGRFRFNVRSFDVAKAFANTPGGLLAKLKYKLGTASSGEHRWTQDQPAEFNGNQFTVGDLRAVIERAGLEVVSIDATDDRLWATARRGGPAG